MKLEYISHTEIDNFTKTEENPQFSIMVPSLKLRREGTSHLVIRKESLLPMPRRKPIPLFCCLHLCVFRDQAHPSWTRHALRDQTHPQDQTSPDQTCPPRPDTHPVQTLPPGTRHTPPQTRHGQQSAGTHPNFVYAETNEVVMGKVTFDMTLNVAKYTFTIMTKWSIKWSDFNWPCRWLCYTNQLQTTTGCTKL